MSTHSSIGVLFPEKDGTRLLKATYCHWNGSVDWNGMILRRYYNTEAAAQSLIELGELSVIRERLAPFAEEKHTFDEQVRGKPYGNLPGGYGIGDAGLWNGSGAWIPGVLAAIKAGTAVKDAFDNAPDFPFDSRGITCAYHRDRGDEYVPPVTVPICGGANEAASQVMNHMDCLFSYLYDCETRAWYVCRCDMSAVVPLDAAIQKLAETPKGKDSIWV